MLKHNKKLQTNTQSNAQTNTQSNAQPKHNQTQRRSVAPTQPNTLPTHSNTHSNTLQHIHPSIPSRDHRSPSCAPRPQGASRYASNACLGSPQSEQRSCCGRRMGWLRWGRDLLRPSGAGARLVLGWEHGLTGRSHLGSYH